ncbi:tyrosine-type recombinase/integrase [Microbulbifer guangxiensis]|uniref:tyrosine-type recombinase/integrase n=1 Tax=Microbulbifer guangxiensis TaxID=2904249 RepID=UPI001F29AF44|nr:integrase arm-type DNA-binding domain-containing protein [Microbulbifer guangxiensis]
MPKRARELTALEVRRITNPGLHAVGGVPGLQLQVQASGAASWILRTTVGTKRRDIGLGPFPEVTLAAAREEARKHRKAIREGRDPVEERKEVRERLIASQAKPITFREAALACHAIKVHEFRNAKHGKQWLRTLENHVFDAIGERPVADIGHDELVAILGPIWTTKTETASRVRQRMENVFDYAIAANLRQAENPARNKLLKPLLPKADKLKKKTGRAHHPALAIDDMPRFMAAIARQQGRAARALEFAILTAARPSEVIGSKVDRKPGASWCEIDTEKALWTIPGTRMKAGLDHSVPLSPLALQLLQDRHGTGEQVFPGSRGGTMSNASMGAVIRRAHEADIAAGGTGFLDKKQGRIATPHGFRSTFKDWALQDDRYPDHWSEIALAHVNDDKTRAAYARGELVKERRKMMEEWANFCCKKFM